MEDVLMEIVKDKVDAKVRQREREREQEVTTIHIKDIMSKLKFSVDQAMDLLSIPQGQRTMYAGLVQNG